VETTWQKEWSMYLLSTTISWCSCGKATIVDESSVICLSTECCLSETIICQLSGAHKVTMQLWPLSFYCWYIEKERTIVFEWMSRGRVKVIKWFLLVLGLKCQDISRWL
jgi:hypothetical protein